jgi:hypothetical protein
MPGIHVPATGFLKGTRCTGAEGLSAGEISRNVGLMQAVRLDQSGIPRLVTDTISRAKDAFPLEVVEGFELRPTAPRSCGEARGHSP